MIFFRKIYINNKPLILTNSIEQYSNDSVQIKDYLMLKGAHAHNFHRAKQHLFLVESTGALIEDTSTEALLGGLQNNFEPVEAAGGVVTNPEGAVLMIYRRGMWDLPKGKRDEGEAIEECAVREVKEETGLPELELTGKICETYHVYSQDDHELLKTTHWFAMKTNKKFALHPQEEEDIQEAIWIDEDKLGIYVRDSYDTIKEVLIASGKTW